MQPARRRNARCHHLRSSRRPAPRARAAHAPGVLQLLCRLRLELRRVARPRVRRIGEVNKAPPASTQKASGAARRLISPEPLPIKQQHAKPNRAVRTLRKRAARHLRPVRKARRNTTPRLSPRSAPSPSTSIPYIATPFDQRKRDRRRHRHDEQRNRGQH